MESSLGLGVPFLSSAILIPLVLWSAVWKGIAIMWKAAQRDQLGWYIALLIINSVGLLPIIYIFLVAPRHPKLGAVPQATTTGP